MFSCNALLLFFPVVSYPVLASPSPLPDGAVPSGSGRGHASSMKFMVTINLKDEVHLLPKAEHDVVPVTTQRAPAPP